VCVEERTVRGCIQKLPVSIAAQSKASTVFGRSNIGIAGLNPSRGMDVCQGFCVFVLPFV
jgi:hypothetical protein